jgi:hypothetical protein
MDQCDACCLAKSHRLPFAASSTIASKLLDFVHCDVWGPSHNGSHYYILFTNQYTRFSWIYFLSQKSEVAAIFSQFKSLVENLFSCHIKILQIDGGIKFLPLLRIYSSIQFHVLCPYTPQQNGLVERRHRFVAN